MDEIQSPKLTSQVKKMAYNVNSYIQIETNNIVFDLTEVKEGISLFTTLLFEKLDKIIDTIDKNKRRTTDSTLKDICNIISQIKIETAEAIYTKVDKLAKTLNKLKNVQQRTSDATKVSPNALLKINHEVNTHFDSQAEDTIKNRFNYFLHTNKEELTINEVRTIMKEESNFQGSYQELYKIIKSMGFEMKRSKNNRVVLIESQRLCSLHIKYLHDIIKYQQDARPIVYINHLSVKLHPNAKDNKLGSVEVQEPIRVVCAASIKGMVPNSLLTFNGAFKMNANDNRNIEIYEKWCQMQLLPNIPPMSVVIIDYSLYHEDDTFCLRGSTEAEMQAWLTSKNIDFDKGFSSNQLSEIIKAHMEKLFSIDELLLNQGHDVVHLPKYLAELNPLKIAFNKFIQYVNNTSINDLKKLIEGNKRFFEGQQWEERWCAVKCRENCYANRHNIVTNDQRGGTPRPYQVFIVTDPANENVKCELTREDENEAKSLSDNENSNTSDMESVFKWKSQFFI